MPEVEWKIIGMGGLENFGNEEVIPGGIGLESLEFFVDVVADAGTDLIFILTISHLNIINWNIIHPIGL